MSYEVHISKGGAMDLPAIMPVMKSAFAPAFGEAWSKGQCLGLLSLPGTSLTLARRKPSIAGFSLVRSVLDEAELMLIAVRPSEQGRGIGHALLEEAKAWSRTQGALRLFLEVRSGNSAVSLYESAGFIQVGCRKDYYRGALGEKSDALTLSVSLA